MARACTRHAPGPPFRRNFERPSLGLVSSLTSPHRRWKRGQSGPKGTREARRGPRRSQRRWHRRRRGLRGPCRRARGPRTARKKGRVCGVGGEGEGKGEPGIIALERAVRAAGARSERRCEGVTNRPEERSHHERKAWQRNLLRRRNSDESTRRGLEMGKTFLPLGLPHTTGRSESDAQQQAQWNGVEGIRKRESRVWLHDHCATCARDCIQA